ncbi:MAG: hypothetical protein KAS38_20825 [Anaerolineales bacterium]|nr:hypothetical protein [Anaerolineales bacterium]
MDIKIIISLIGWLGAISYLVAYLLVSLRKLEGDSITFQTLNLVGGVCLTINTYYNTAYPATALNLAWVCIAIYTISKKKLSTV